MAIASGQVASAADVLALLGGSRCAAVYASNSGSQSSGAYWRMSGLTELSDVDSMMDNSTGLVTIPDTGVYTVRAGLNFSNAGSTTRRALIVEVGSGSAGSGTEKARVEIDNPNRWTGSICADLSFTAGDEVSIVAYGSGAAWEIRGGDFACWFSITPFQ